MLLSEELLEATAKGQSSYHVLTPKKLHRKHHPRQRHEIDDKWIAGIRKWWKQIVAKEKTYPGRPKDNYTKAGDWDSLAKAADSSIAYLETVVKAIEQLRTDLMFVKGLWNRSVFKTTKTSAKRKRWLKKNDPETLDLILDLEREDEAEAKPTTKTVEELNKAISGVKDGISSIKWFKEQSHPEGKFSPGFGVPIYKNVTSLPDEYNSMMRTFRIKTEEAIEQADKAISGRMLRTLSKVVKQQGDIGGRFSRQKETPVEDTVNFGKVTLMFRDIPVDPRKKTVMAPDPWTGSGKFPVGTEGVGVAPKDRKRIITQVKKAQTLLQKAGLGHVWYGKVTKYPEGTYKEFYGTSGKTQGRAAAAYTRHKDSVHLYSNDVDAESIVHELGHRYYYKFLSAAQRGRFKAWFGKIDAPSQYGGTDEVEEFAELFRAHVVGRHSKKYRRIILTRDQRNRFGEFLGRTRKLESRADELVAAL